MNIPKPVKMIGMLVKRIPSHETATPTAINHAGSIGRLRKVAPCGPQEIYPNEPMSHF